MLIPKNAGPARNRAPNKLSSATAHQPDSNIATMGNVKTKPNVDANNIAAVSSTFSPYRSASTMIAIIVGSDDSATPAERESGAAPMTVPTIKTIAGAIINLIALTSIVTRQ